MKAWIVLAEAATAHPDGTLSMLRAGIGRLFGPEPPFTFRGALAVRIESDAADLGVHKFSIRSTRTDGGGPLPTMDGEFTVETDHGVVSFAAVVQVAKLGPGELRFELLVDELPLSQWVLKVDQSPR
jgi:hypothetical protein